MATKGYLDLFRHREFRALWTGNALGVAATTMSSLTLGTLVYAQTGSSLLTAVTMFGPSLVQVVGASTLMSAADTTAPRPVLVTLAAAMALTFAAQALFDLAPASRVGIVLVAAYILSIGSGVRWGVLSEITPADDYALARSAMNVSVGVMQIVGFATGGLLLHVLTVGKIFWLAAAFAALAVPITWAGIGAHAPRRVGRTGMRETWRGNRALLGSPSTRALMLALCVPNGLVAGCEALFVPYAGDQAASLFVAAAVGMLIGDVLMGRVLTPTLRRVCTRWLLVLLAAPFLAFLWNPELLLAALLTGAACVGYGASLGQQELLVKLTPASLSGQVLGAEGAARVTCQGLGAVVAGSLAAVMPPAATIALLALASLLVSVGLMPSLARAERYAATTGVRRLASGRARTLTTRDQREISTAGSLP